MQGGWKCVGAASGSKFDDVDLSEGEWVDYDEKVRPSQTTLHTHMMITDAST
jgi:hypothetical protein